MTEEERLKNLRAVFENNAPAENAVEPATTDKHASTLAKLRSEMTTDRLLARDPQRATEGYVQETPDWNMGMSVGNGMLQGLLPQILGDIRARRADPSQQFTPFGIGLKSAQELPAYEQNVNQLKAAREAYGQENSGKALFGELGGSLSTLIPTMAAGSAGLAGIAGKAVASAPWLSGITDFLSGASKVRELKAASQAVRGGMEGVTAAAGSSNLFDAPLKEQMEGGGVAGMLLGPAAGLIANKTKSHVNQTTGDSAQALIDQGIAVRAGQIPGSGKGAQVLDKMFGGGNAAQREAFGEKLTGYAGLPEKEVSQGWVAKNDQRVGKIMNDIQGTYSIPQAEGQLGMDLLAARAKAIQNLSPDNAKKAGQFIDKIETANTQGINGNIYKNLTQKGGILDNMKADKDIANLVPTLRETLDDAWGRALPVDKKAAWDEARKHYKVTRVIDESMGGTGAAEGVYNPKKLLKAVENHYGNVENAGDLGMLARGGQFLEAPGAAPASSHMKLTPVNVAGGLAAATAVSEGTRAIHHYGPELWGHIASHPAEMTIPLLLGLGAAGATKATNYALNNPKATQYLLDISRGSRNPLLMGNNPMLPMLVEGYNRQ